MTDLVSWAGSEIVAQAPRIYTTSSSCLAVLLWLASVDGVFLFLCYFPPTIIIIIMIILIIIYYLFGANISMNIFRCALQVTLK